MSKVRYRFIAHSKNARQRENIDSAVNSLFSRCSGKIFVEQRCFPAVFPLFSPQEMNFAVVQRLSDKKTQKTKKISMNFSNTY